MSMQINLHCGAYSKQNICHPYAGMLESCTPQVSVSGFDDDQSSVFVAVQNA